MLFTLKLHSYTDRAKKLVDKKDKVNGLLDRAHGLLDKAHGPLDRESKATCNRNGEESMLLFLNLFRFFFMDCYIDLPIPIPICTSPNSFAPRRHFLPNFLHIKVLYKALPLKFLSLSLFHHFSAHQSLWFS